MIGLHVKFGSPLLAHTGCRHSPRTVAKGKGITLGWLPRVRARVAALGVGTLDIPGYASRTQDPRDPTYSGYIRLFPEYSGPEYPRYILQAKTWVHSAGPGHSGCTSGHPGTTGYARIHTLGYSGKPGIQYISGTSGYTWNTPGTLCGPGTLRISRDSRICPGCPK